MTYEHRSSVHPRAHASLEHDEREKEHRMEETLLEMLDQFEIGKPASHGPLHLFPLLGGAVSEEGLSLLEESLQEGTLRVEELDESGSVPELRVINGGARPVLILEGDELVGAKQNRTVNSSVLVAAESELVLPVTCVERGRWSYRSRAFSSGDGSPHLALRHLKSRTVHDSLKRGRGHRSDQDAVWEEVERKASLHDAPSPTHALQDSRAHLSERLAAFEKLAEELPEGTRGVVVALGDRPVLIEVLAGPRSFARASRKLLSGYAFEAVGLGEGGGPPDPSSVKGLIEAAAKARREEHRAVGSGRDVRFEADGISGYALVVERGVLHAAVFADQAS
jgi:hypothetical protein